MPSTGENHTLSPISSQNILRFAALCLRGECDMGPPDSGPHPLPDSGPPDCSPPRSGQCSPHKLSRGDYCRENNGSSPPSKFRSSRGETTRLG